MVLQFGSRVSSIWARNGHVPPTRGNLNHRDVRIPRIFGSIFCMLTMCKRYFDINILLQLNTVIGYTLWCLKVGPGFLTTGPGWSNAAKKCHFEPFIYIAISTYVGPTIHTIINYDLNLISASIYNDIHSFNVFYFATRLGTCWVHVPESMWVYAGNWNSTSSLIISLSIHTSRKQIPFIF